LPDVICDTSPIQYLYQLDLLHILPALAHQIIVPPAVMKELAEGRALGISLPDLNALDWVTVRHPVSEPALPLITDLGPGETQALMLALELGEAIVVIDDALARQVAETSGIHLTGTLGLLLDAKRAGLVTAVSPLLDKLQALRFYLAPHTRTAILELAQEDP
jgi:predicted nucleic acid-binding protein